MTGAPERPRPREGGVLISQIHHLSGRIFSSLLRAYGIRELSPAQGRIVYELWKEGDLTQTQLAARTKLDKSTLTLMLDRLEAADQVERSRGIADARTRIVNLSEKNGAVRARYRGVSERMVSLFYKGLSGEEIDRFEATMRHVIANLEAAARKAPGRAR